MTGCTSPPFAQMVAWERSVTGRPVQFICPTVLSVISSLRLPSLGDVRISRLATLSGAGSGTNANWAGTSSAATLETTPSRQVTALRHGCRAEIGRPGAYTLDEALSPFATFRMGVHRSTVA